MIATVRYLCSLATDLDRLLIFFATGSFGFFPFFFSISYFLLHSLLAHHSVIFAYLFRSETVSTVVPSLWFVRSQLFSSRQGSRACELGKQETPTIAISKRVGQKEKKQKKIVWLSMSFTLPVCVRLF